MINKNKNRHGVFAAAQNCKKVLKNVKIRTAALTAFAAAVTALCAALASSGEVPLTAELTDTRSSAAIRTVMPAKEYDVSICVDGKTIGVKSSGTVADALAAADIRVFDDDLINIGFGELLNPKTKIVINRVNIVEEVQVESIDYATKYKEDDSYLIGYSEVVVDGEEGEVEKTLRHVYIDGELVSSAVIDEDVTEPVDEVVVVGTRENNPVQEVRTSLDAPLDLVLDENGVPLEYSKVLTGKSCAYTASAGALTASGRTAMVGHVAVDPSIIPYGTELYITTADGSEVYGYAVAADTGGALLDGRILVDLFMNTYDECCQWGARQVNIYILD